MRRTTREVECDRCGLVASVRSWEFKDVKPLGDKGWSSYQSFALYAYSRPTSNGLAKDLCPRCTAGMQDYMNMKVHTFLLVDTFTKEQLLLARKDINRKLRIMRNS